MGLMSDFNFPPDLVDLRRTYEDLQEQVGQLPALRCVLASGVVFREGVEATPEWEARSAELWGRWREASAALATHPFWATVAVEARVAARTGLKQVAARE